MRLLATIEQDESGYYLVEVPALPGCVSQGRTIAEAKANIKEAIIGWLAVMNNKARQRRLRKVKELGFGLLRSLIKQANLSVEEFNDL